MEIILIGGGGHCRSVVDVIEAENKYRIRGVLDKSELVGSKVLDYEIIGTDAEIPDLCKRHFYFLITVGQILTGNLRERLFADIRRENGRFATVISPIAYVSNRASVGEGTVVMHKAVVNTSASVGDNCIINTGAVIEHDAIVGNHCHISTGAFINGEVTVNDNSFIGSNATVNQCVNIAAGTILAAGSVAIKNTKPFSLYAGVPAVFKKSLHDQ